MSNNRGSPAVHTFTVYLIILDSPEIYNGCPLFSIQVRVSWLHELILNLTEHILINYVIIYYLYKCLHRALCVNIFWLIHIGLLEMFQNTFLNLTLRSGTFQEIFKISGQNHCNKDDVCSLSVVMFLKLSHTSGSSRMPMLTYRL